MNGTRIFLTLLAFMALLPLKACGLDSHDVDSRQVEPYPVGAQPAHEFHLNLVGYLDDSLGPAAEKVQMGDLQGALRWLSKAKLKHPTAIEQSHYLKGLSFQSLKQFESSIAEYRWIEKHSTDGVLRKKATIGRKLADQKISVIRPEQIVFPGGPQLPSPID
jgi:hypothetical protein